MNSFGRNGNSNSDRRVFTKETLGVVLTLFSTLSVVCLISRDKIFSVPGQILNSFLFGCFGYFAYLVFGLLAFVGVLMLIGKKLKIRKSVVALVSLFFLFTAMLLQVITMKGDASLSYGEYISKAYLMAEESGVTSCSAGGFFTALLTYLPQKLFTEVGCYVVFSVLIALSAYALISRLVKKKAEKPHETDKFKGSFVEEAEEIANENNAATEETVREVPVTANKPQKAGARLFVNEAAPFEFKSKREIKNEEKESLKNKILGNKPTSSSDSSYSTMYGEEIRSKMNYIKTPPSIDVGRILNDNNNSNGGSYGNVTISGVIKRETYGKKEETKPEIPYTVKDGNAPETEAEEVKQRSEEFSEKYVNEENFMGNRNVSAKPENNVAENTAVKETPVGQESDNGGLSKPETEVGRFSAEHERGRFSSAEPETSRFSPERETGRFSQDGETGRFSADNEQSRFTPESETKEEEPETNEFERRFSSRITENDSEKEDEPTISPVQSRRAREILFDNENKEENNGEERAFISRAEKDGNDSLGGFRDTSLYRRGRNLEENVPEVTEEPTDEAPSEELLAEEDIPINREYFRPPLDLLVQHNVGVERPKENHEERMEIIQRTLEEFKINAIPQSYVQGPSITRYEIMMPAGISVKRVLAYDDDLKMRLAAKDGVRIEAPIPGKNLVGIEVANQVKVTVGLREVLEGIKPESFKENSLMFAIGKNLVGESIADNLAKGPHYLVAGATGSGKSVCLNVMIISLIMRYSPEEMRLILVDPKRVEFRSYEHLPHLMTDEIITEPKAVLAMLTWAYEEMERRYKVFESSPGFVVDIEGYNKNVASDTVAKMPRIVIIIDELADLMESCKRELESKIRLLAQKARSAGIHLVLATQRPSVDIITGTIKANLPSRIAFKVMNFNDSQTILGEQGAEKLLGNGDMLYKNSVMPGYERYQGAFISTREVNAIVSYIKEHNKAYFDKGFTDYMNNALRPKTDETAVADNGGDNTENSANNALFIQALDLAVNSGTIAISQIQRHFQIGYARAGGIIDKMEKMGYVSVSEGSKARKVLLTREEFEARYGNANE